MGAAFLTSMLASFQAVLSLGMHTAGPATFTLYKILATLEIAGLGLWWLYSRENNIGLLIFRVLTLTAFMYLMHEWQILVGTIQASFMKLGILVGGNQLDLPTVHGAGMALINKGHEYSLAIQGKVGDPTLWQSVGVAIDALAPTQASMEKWVMGWLVWILFAIAGIHVFVTQLEFVFYSAVAFVTVPFATWSRTAWIAERTFGAVLSVGLKLTFLYALLSASLAVLKQAVLPPTLTQQDGIFMICTGLLLCFLQVAAHRLASGLMHGMPSLSHTDVLPRVGTALSVTTGAITMAASAMTNAVTQLTRIVQRMRRP